MAGFILGTGSGVLAAAAVYYTISTSISASTSSLRSELHNSTHLLTISLSPTPLPAPSSYLGLRHPPSPTFSEILRSRWNLALGRAVGGVRETDWAGVGMAVWSEGRGLASKLGGQAEKVVEKVQEVRREEAGYVVGEKYTGGSEGVVKRERDSERRVEGRLV